MELDRESKDKEIADRPSQDDDSIVHEKTAAVDGPAGPATAAAAPEVPASEYPHGSRLVIIVAAIIFTIFILALDMTIVATAIPRITDEFKGLSNVSWYGSAYFMTFGGFQSSWGKIYRYIPLKVAFVISLFIFELGSLVCGVAPNAVALICGRAVAGVGGAGLATGTFTIIAFAAPPRKRPQLIGMCGAVYGIAAVAGPLLGGTFTEKLSWRWCFYINLPIGAVAGAVIVLLFRTPSKAKSAEASLKEKLLQMDLVGVALAMGAIISFILAFQSAGQTRPWNSSVVIGLLVGFVLICITFIAWAKYQGERAMVVPRLIVNRWLCVGCAYMFCFAGSYFIILYYIPIYFQSVDGTTPIGSGVRNIPMVISVSIASITGGTFISKTGRPFPVLIFGATLATICTGLLYTFNINTPEGKWIGYQIVGGVGWGVSWGTSMAIAQAHARPEDISRVSATLLFFQTLGGSLSISAAQSAFVNTIIRTLAKTDPSVDAAKVILTGATQIRTAFTADQVPHIVDAYMAGLKVVFAISIGLAGTALPVALCATRKNIHTLDSKPVEKAADTTAEKAANDAV